MDNPKQPVIEISTEAAQGYALALFAEMNEHLRSTENKYMTISAAYLGLITLISSLSTEAAKVGIGVDILTTYVLMILTGCTVTVLQRWYRQWKAHYLQVCRSIFRHVPIAEDLRPFWLREVRRTSFLSADDVLSYFTNLVNTYVVIRLCCYLFLQSERITVRVLLPIIVLLLYIAFVIAIRTSIPRQGHLSA